MKRDFFFGAALAIGIFLGFGAWVSSVSDHVVEKQCLNTGRALIGNSVYECRRIGDEVKP